MPTETAASSLCWVDKKAKDMTLDRRYKSFILFVAENINFRNFIYYKVLSNLYIAKLI